MALENAKSKNSAVNLVRAFSPWRLGKKHTAKIAGKIVDVRGT